MAKSKKKAKARKIAPRRPATKKPATPKENWLPPARLYTQFGNEAKAEDRGLLVSTTADEACDWSKEGGGGNGIVGVYRLMRTVRLKRVNVIEESRV